jgi:2-methylisocitrate lyase-like PEP mutase family enzyme
MITDQQRQKADRLLALHHGPPILVLPNAWDAVSARLFELEGFKAIGTTSAGVSAALGYPDGQYMSAGEATEAVRRIAGCVTIPASVDIEAGYAPDAAGVAETARTVMHAGAVGLNLEDGTGDPARPLCDTSLMAERIAAIRKIASAENMHFVINARTDVYLAGDDSDPATQFRNTVGRASAYREVGADCIFVPDMGNLDRQTIARLVQEIPAPLNVIAGERTPSLPELEDMGVARVSFGPRPMRAALALVRRIAREWKETGTYSTMVADALSYAEVNAMFT